MFLGNRIKQRMFGDQPVVGREVTLWGMPFTVIGVMTPKTPVGYYNGRDRDKVVIPASTFRTLRGWRSVSFLLFGVADKSHHLEAVNGIYRVLGRRHRFAFDDLGAIRVRDHVSDMATASSIVTMIRYLILVVGILGMLVALVGVANVMYVMVEERRREFGIQMALGARPGWIARQRLIEGGVVTVVGAVIGVSASAAAMFLIAQIPMDDMARGYLGDPTVSLGTAIVVACSLGIAGAVAGYIPARRAAAIQPIEALRED